MAHSTCNLIPVHLESDRWLMQSLIQHSSSDQAREAAAAWVAAYDMALALGLGTAEAQLDADMAYRNAAARSGLPGIERRAA